MTKLHKTFAIEVKEHRKNGGRIRISTDSVDRYRDRVMPSGANIQNYMANPVVQWGHNYFEPWATIGKTNKIEIGEHTIDVDFDLRPAANQSDPQNVVLLLWNGGWINTASIGFNPMEKVEDEPFITENEHGGRDFLNWDLLEWSLVPIPANQDALRLAVKAFDGIPERSVELPNGNEIVYPQIGANPPEIVTSRHMKIVDDSTANESSIYQSGIAINKLPGQLVDSSVPYIIKSDPDIDAIVDLVIERLIDGGYIQKQEEVFKTAISYSVHGDVSRAPEEMRWSGGGARRRLKEWAGGDEWEPSLYRRGFVQLDGEADLITSYKGPHHDIVDGTFSVVLRGAMAAMGSLVFGAREGRIEDDRERRAVYNHLAREYARFDRDAPEFREYSEEEVKDLFPDELYEEAQEPQQPEELDALAEQLNAFLEQVKTTI